MQGIVHILFLAERLMGKREQATLAEEPCLVLINDDRDFIQLSLQMREEFIIAVSHSLWRGIGVRRLGVSLRKECIPLRVGLVVGSRLTVADGGTGPGRWKCLRRALEFMLFGN